MQIRQEVNNNSKLPTHFTNNRKKINLKNISSTNSQKSCIHCHGQLHNEYLLKAYYNIMRIMYCSNTERVKNMPRVR